MTISDVLSLSGLAVAVFALLISWRAYHRDEPKIRFTGLEFEVPSDLEKARFVVTIVNVGGRGAMLERGLLKLQSGEEIDWAADRLWASHGLPPQPFEFKAGSKLPVAFHIYDESLEYPRSRYTLRFTPNEVSEAVFVDTVGKEYSKKVPRALKRRIRSQQWPQEIPEGEDQTKLIGLKVRLPY